MNKRLTLLIITNEIIFWKTKSSAIVQHEKATKENIPIKRENMHFM